MAALNPLTQDREYIFVVVLGLFLGSLIGAMAQIIPYALVLLTGMGVVVLAWRQEGSITLIVVVFGLLIGSLFGNMGAIMPWGVTVFLAIILGVMIWKSQAAGDATGDPTSALTLILLIITGVGLLFNGTNADFCNPNNVPGFNACLTPQPSGYITAYQGCVQTCAITAFAFLGNSPLTFILNGDFLGFFNTFIRGFQTSFILGDLSNFFWSIISGILAAAIGAILLFLGAGVGVQADILASGGSITPNEAGTRLFQSLGIALVVWAAVTSLIFGFGQWFAYIGFGLGGGIGGGALYVMFLVYYCYQAYLQGKNIA